MRQWGMDLGGLQTDDQLPTGRVDVRFADGEPDYDIVRPCAYDAIERPPVDGACELLYHGSLAVREHASSHALAQLLESRPRTVFVDVNLRPPWWRREQVQAMLQGADWVKLNADELTQLHPAGSGGVAADLLTAYDLRGVILTRGAQGAEVLTAEGQRFGARPTVDVAVVDTVGAGDAFASVIILGLLNAWPLDVTLERAQAFASRVVGNRGATVSDPAFYQPFVEGWNLTA